LFGLKGTSAVAGTALDDAIAGSLLLPGPAKPRAVDVWPIFHTGVPNLRPYQLATGKEGSPLAEGKPFINNFLPNGGDIRRRETTDMAAQVYVVWPRFPRLLRSRIIGYVWDTTAPMATIARSQKTATVTFVVMRSGPEDLGKWITERRNVAEDYAKIFGEAPEDPGAITISIDSNDTQSMAEFSLGSIAFRPR
jgi:hypothetical protein